MCWGELRVNACCRFAGVMSYANEENVSGRKSRRLKSEELSERVGGNDRAVELSDCSVGPCYVEQRDCGCHHHRADVRLSNGIINREYTCAFTDQN
jgi:hypothetical protein